MKAEGKIREIYSKWNEIREMSKEIQVKTYWKN
jgi:hypothetical protein